ncbi:MAG: hypothetical protein LBP87_14800 [Planctomycetaceae bacterium]|jgi:hypothetical protein|nr:hypothetical protein [Planctomycetaceae bacterium]
MKLKIIIVMFSVFFCTVSSVVAEVTVKKTVDPRFARADTNQDGKLDQMEFEQYLALLSKMKLAKPKLPEPTPIEKRYGNKGSYMESAMGYAFVPVKSVSETVLEKKEGGCCGKKSKTTEIVETVKEGGCCGKKTETTEIVETVKENGCCGKMPEKIQTNIGSAKCGSCE